jgi:catechol 2,3-dioxygenase-like lactoylglutathione lyase family enzyme
MIKKISLSGIWVSDQDKSIEFFVDKLGFELQEDVMFGNYRWVEVIPPGAETGIPLAKAYPGQEVEIGGFTNIVFSTDDIKTTFEEMKSKGVIFMEEPAEQEWGMMQAMFKDVDDNIFLLVERE